MDTHMMRLVRQAVLARWETGQRRIESADVYHHLLALGEDVPTGALQEIFAVLQQRGAIEATPWDDVEAVAVHGGLSITWIDPTKL